MKSSLIVATFISCALARDTHLSPEDWDNAKTYEDPPGADPPMRASPGLYQMDIKEDQMLLNGYSSRGRNMLWRGAKVPYVIRESKRNGRFGKKQKAAIAHAMLQFHKRTVVRFTPRRTEHNYISFVRKGIGLDGHCWTTVGRSARAVNLAPPSATTGDCAVSYIIQHELMHVLGFHHEQSRPDRDEYVTINTGNIDKRISHSARQFARQRNGLSMGLPYDCYSLMHYGQHFCAK